MNYKIKASSADVTIGGLVITTTPIYLVSVEFVLESDKGLLVNKVDSGELIIQEGGIDALNGHQIASQYVQLQNDFVSERSKVLQDLNEQERYIDISQLGELYASIDLSYTPRHKIGKNYSRKRTAMLVFDIINATVTEDEAFLVEEKTEKAFNKLNNGHFKSAKKYIKKEPVEGIFTQVFKDQLVAEIGTLIANHY